MWFWPSGGGTVDTGMAWVVCFFLFLLPKPGFSFEILFVFILLSGEGKEGKGSHCCAVFSESLGLVPCLLVNDFLTSSVGGPCNGYTHKKR